MLDCKVRFRFGFVWFKEHDHKSASNVKLITIWSKRIPSFYSHWWIQLWIDSVGWRTRMSVSKEGMFMFGSTCNVADAWSTCVYLPWNHQEYGRAFELMLGNFSLSMLWPLELWLLLSSVQLSFEDYSIDLLICSYWSLVEYFLALQSMLAPRPNRLHAFFLELVSIRLAQSFDNEMVEFVLFVNEKKYRRIRTSRPIVSNWVERKRPQKPKWRKERTNGRRKENEMKK